jgi:hypothetical protein
MRSVSLSTQMKNRYNYYLDEICCFSGIYSFFFGRNTEYIRLNNIQENKFINRNKQKDIINQDKFMTPNSHLNKTTPSYSIRNYKNQTYDENTLQTGKSTYVSW